MSIRISRRHWKRTAIREIPPADARNTKPGSYVGRFSEQAYVDPYNHERLSFAIFQELASLRKVDLAVNFSTMDLQRNVEFEFDPERARFDDVAPGWRKHPPILAASKRNVKLTFFNYWCDLVKGLGFQHSQQMPLVRNNQGHGIYRMIFISRHSFPKGIWDDVARDHRRTLDMFDR